MEQAYAQEYLTGNESIAFPFKEDAEGLAGAASSHGTAALLPRDFLLDLVATIPAGYQEQIYLKSIARAGSTYTFVFGGAATSPGLWSITAMPAERSVVSFQNSVDRITLRMVTGPSFATYLQAMSNPSTDEFQLRLPLETATVEFTPHKLLDLLLGAQELAGDIVLYEGYNIELVSTPQDPASGLSSRLTINAGSGLGAGKYNPCSEHTPLDYIGRINGQTADESGNLRLDGDTCFRILPDAWSSRIQIANDCLPCCTCDDYANMVEALRALYVRFKAAKDALDATVLKVNQDIVKWNDEIVPVLFKVTADIYVTRGNQTGVFTDPDRRTSSGKSPNFASVVSMVRNPSPEALTGISVAVTGFTDETVMQTVYFDDAGQHLGGIETSFTGLTIASGRYFKVIILVRKPYPAGVTGTFTVTVTIPGSDPVTKSVTVA